MYTSVSGMPRVMLRVEGLVLLSGTLIAFDAIGAPWALFAMVYFVPDLALLAYVAGRRTGAFVYNLSHSSVGPAILAALSFFGVIPPAWPICLIWMAHIGMDRTLGLGLKYPTSIKDTHLGRWGRVPATA